MAVHCTAGYSQERVAISCDYSRPAVNKGNAANVLRLKSHLRQLWSIRPFLPNRMSHCHISLKQTSVQNRPNFSINHRLLLKTYPSKLNGNFNSAGSFRILQKYIDTFVLLVCSVYDFIC